MPGSSGGNPLSLCSVARVRKEREEDDNADSSDDFPNKFSTSYHLLSILTFP